MAINAPVTLHDFEQFVHLPKNSERFFEYVRGEILEVVSNNYSSQIAAEMIFQIKLHMKASGIKGHVTGADGGYQIGNDRYIPDVGYISYERQPQPSREAYNPLAPDLAIEVISPTDDEKKLRIKVGNYLSANVVVWVVNPDDQTVEVYRPAQPVSVYHINGTIDGAPVFPNLQLPLADIFPAEENTDSTDSA